MAWPSLFCELWVRWNSPYINQFTQPDSIIPDPYNPQAWNRYAYAFNNPIRYNDPSGHCPICLTAAIGGAIGGIVGAVGYTAYVATTGKEFNSTHFWMATGGGAVAGALIGTGVGAVEGRTIAGTTTAAVEAGTAVEGANLACGGDMCSGEVQGAANSVEEAAPALENAVTQAGDDVVQTVQEVTDKARTVDQFLSDSQSFIGDRYKQMASGVYRAIDGVRQVRFTDRDLLPTHGNIGPHAHFEILNDLGDVIKNIHIPLIEN